MLAVTGLNTTIVQEYLNLRPDDVERIEATPSLAHPTAELRIPNADRFILAAGVLHGKGVLAMTEKEVIETLCVNLVNTMRICEKILATRLHARICVVGSESGVKWSYDDVYAASKAALHRYVEVRVTTRTQQLVCVAPPIIRDSGMTMRRKDYPDVLKRRRTVTAKYVAETISGLFTPEIDLNNTVVRL